MHGKFALVFEYGCAMSSCLISCCLPAIGYLFAVNILIEVQSCAIINGCVSIFYVI
ncbi:hypothetical protein FB480_101679 [Agrobacterium vitis]|nr:hypothetical protein FB480_101679 [Agrobacterium vitis]